MDDNMNPHESELDKENTDEVLPSSVESGPILEVEEKFSEEVEDIKSGIREASKLLVGQEELVKLMITALITEGHILLEGVPGIAKTLSARVVAKIVDTNFSRIQFTPDLMPSDILGTSIFDTAEGIFKFRKGPIFSNVILIDEINRAPAKSQAALFEVMEERQITFDGERYPMEYPFLVIATQNPIEQEGTYRLPEAQLDRFLFRIIVDYPNFEEEVEILKRFNDATGRYDLNDIQPIFTKEKLESLQKASITVHIEDQIRSYIVNLVQATRSNARLFLGASPRASLAIMRASRVVAMLSGRAFVIPDDVQYIAPFVLNHRILLTPEAEISGMDTFSVIQEIINEVEVPR